jgi:hypothetical protein
MCENMGMGRGWERDVGEAPRGGEAIQGKDTE